MNAVQIRAHHQRLTAQIAALKGHVAQDIARALEAKQLTQTEAAYIMKDAPSQISLVVTGKLRGFSLERLLRMRAMLGGQFVLQLKDRRPAVLFAREA
jgi:predicted XRE-type DNA-binding protein